MSYSGIGVWGPREMEGARRATGISLAARLLHDPLEHIVIGRVLGGGRFGVRQAEGVAQLRQKERVVRSLLATLLTVAGDTRSPRMVMSASPAFRVDNPRRKQARMSRSTSLLLLA